MIAKRSTILVIDDNPENLLVLGAALESEYDCRLAASGPQGLILAAQNPPELILLDIMMPEVDGFETYRRLKADPKLNAIPIIFLTALSDMETEIAGLTMGAVDYITKPINVALVKRRVMNILRLTQLAQDLKSSEERLRLVMETTGEGVWDWHLPTGTVVHNASWCHILGLDQSFLSHPVDLFSQHIHPEDLVDVQQRLSSSLSSGLPYYSEHRMRTMDGNYIWVSDRGKVVEREEHGAPRRMVGAMVDINERKTNETEIHKLAFFDTLTGLPNRRLLIDRLHHSIVKNQRSKKLGALMFLDMDRFKLLNDTHGHAMGDALLVQVASRLQSCVREADTVARIGGDEFVIMLEDLPDSAEQAMTSAHGVGSKILAALNEPYQLESIRYNSTPSIGLTLFSSQNENVDAVLKRADAAMYEAKSAGRNTIKLHQLAPLNS